MNLPYILQVQLCIALFWIAYRLFLQNSGAFAQNRAYLLGSMLLAFIIPALSIPILPAAVPAGLPFILSEIAAAPAPLLQETWSWQTAMGWVYGIGVAILLLGLLWQILGLSRKLRTAHRTRFQGTRIVSSEKIRSPFSFFGYIFINSEQMNREQLPQVVAHELCHVRLYHSVDSVLIQLMQILLWWNPFVWLWGRSLKEVHEYQADEAVLNQGFDSKPYITLLIGTLADIHPEFVSGFSYSLIKKRLLMMTNKKEGRFARYRILLALPVVMLSLGLFACTEKETAEAIDQMLGVETRTDGTVAIPTDVLLFVDDQRVESIEDINPDLIESIEVIKTESPTRILIRLKEGADLTAENNGPSTAGRIVSIRSTNEDSSGGAEPTELRVFGIATTDAAEPSERTVIVSSNTPENITLHVEGEPAKSTLSASTTGSTTPGEVIVRSITSNSTGDPIMLLDGKRITPAEMKNLNPDNIQSISVLKDATSTESYGPEGANGVILITSKEIIISVFSNLHPGGS